MLYGAQMRIQILGEPGPPRDRRIRKIKIGYFVYGSIVWIALFVLAETGVMPWRLVSQIGLAVTVVPHLIGVVIWEFLPKE